MVRIKHGTCMPFLGAGASYGALPLGSEIARRWATEFGYPLGDTDNLPRVAQYLALAFGDGMFPKYQIAGMFKDKAPPEFGAAGEPHGVLASLPLPIYMTTNYDDFMVRALSARDKEVVREICRWSKVSSHLPSVFNSSYVPSVQHPVVFHLHGHLDEPGSMVLTEDDYLDFLVRITSDQDLLPRRIQEAFTDTTILFLGYGFADWDFRVLFRALAEYLEKSASTVHVSVQLLPVPEEMAAEQKGRVQEYFEKYYEHLHVRVFWGTCHEFIGELDRRWKAFNGNA